MKKYIYILLTAIVTITLHSCQDAAKPIPPTFKGFVVSPKPCHPGDTLNVKLYFADKGEYIISPKANWTLSIDTLGADGTQNKCTFNTSKQGSIVNEYLGGQFIIPTNAVAGRKTCSVRVDFQCSADASEYPSRTSVVQPGFEGTLGVSQIKSPLYGDFSGSVNIDIAD